jgi:hypothetical protein
VAGIGQQLSRELVEQFIQCIGIYPTGSCVILQSGRLGVVVDQRPDQLLTPRVKVFYSTTSRMPLKSDIVDLAHGSDKIVAYADPAKWGIRSLPSIDLL